MNKKQRDELSNIIQELEGIKSRIEELQEQEQDKYDALPENLQQTEANQNIESASETLLLAADTIGEAIGNIEEVINQ